MQNQLNKIELFFSNLVRISKYTKTKNKKLKIFFIGIINNFLVFFDILIILYFTKLLSENIDVQNKIVLFLLDLTYLFPIFVVLRFLIIYFERIFVTKLQFDIEESLRTNLLNDVFDRGNISIADAFYYTNTLSGQVASFYSSFSLFIGSFFQILIFTIYLMMNNLQAVIIFALGSVVLILPTYFLMKNARKVAHITYNSGNEISENMENILQNLFLIKILKQISHEVINFKNSLQDYYTSRFKDIQIGTVNTLLPNFVTLFFLSLIMVFFNFGKYLTLDFIGILIRLFQSLGNFNKHFHSIATFHVYLDKLEEIESSKTSVNSNNYKSEQNNKDETIIEFENVSFKYLGQEKNMFEGLNIKLQKNKHYIVTGDNGVGKSTFLGLATGIFYASSGLVKSSARTIGYVSAYPMIIRGTLKENLLYGNVLNVEEDQIISLIKSFSVFTEKENIDLSKQIDNKTLSTGQMQKIAFIRALLHKIDFLVLDESTSNLDYKTKKEIFSILESLNLTILNSTHNPEDFQNIDANINISLDNDYRVVELKEFK